MNVKKIIVVWDDENYNNRQEAEADGAISTFEIPDYVTDVSQYINAFSQALMVAGDRIAANRRRLSMQVIDLKPFSVIGRVLEWNEYTVTAWAESEEIALQDVKARGLVTYPSDDVSSGMESANLPDLIITEKDIRINS